VRAHDDERWVSGVEDPHVLVRHVGLSNITAFDEAMTDEGPNIPWEQVKADLG
jgi:hypothetical protein